MTEFFEFADLVADFSGLPITRIIPGQKDQFTPAGKLIPQLDTVEEITGAALVPFSNYQLQTQLNGMYTEKDRQLYSPVKFNLGDHLEQSGQHYKVDRLSPYDQWTDVFIYYCKGWEKPKAGGPQDG